MKKSITLVVLFIVIFSIVSCKSVEKQEPKYCLDCNGSVAISAKFCEHCGAELSDDSGTNGDKTMSYSEYKELVNDTTHPIEKEEDSCLVVGCYNRPINLSLYCGDHKCAKSGCTSSKYSTSDFCHMHKCDSLGCDNARNDYGYYCGEHSCAERWCSQDRDSFSNYCSFHKCNELGCENKKNDYSHYCSEHECAKSGCNNKKSSFSDYCLTHDD